MRLSPRARHHHLTHERVLQLHHAADHLALVILEPRLVLLGLGQKDQLLGPAAGTRLVTLPRPHYCTHRRVQGQHRQTEHEPHNPDERPQAALPARGVLGHHQARQRLQQHERQRDSDDRQRHPDPAVVRVLEHEEHRDRRDRHRDQVPRQRQRRYRQLSLLVEAL